MEMLVVAVWLYTPESPEDQDRKVRNWEQTITNDFGGNIVLFDIDIYLEQENTVSSLPPKKIYRITFISTENDEARGKS